MRGVTAPNGVNKTRNNSILFKIGEHNREKVMSKENHFLDNSCSDFNLWTLEQAAKRLQVSGSFLRRSSCPIVRLGRRRLFDPEQTAAWARARLTHRVEALV